MKNMQNRGKKRCKSKDRKKGTKVSGTSGDMINYALGIPVEVGDHGRKELDGNG